MVTGSQPTRAMPTPSTPKASKFATGRGVPLNSLSAYPSKASGKILGLPCRLREFDMLPRRLQYRGAKMRRPLASSVTKTDLPPDLLAKCRRLQELSKKVDRDSISEAIDLSAELAPYFNPKVVSEEPATGRRRGASIFDVYRRKSEPSERIATIALAGLPDHVVASDWELSPSESSQVIEDAPEDIAARGFCYFKLVPRG